MHRVHIIEVNGPSKHTLHTAKHDSLRQFPVTYSSAVSLVPLTMNSVARGGKGASDELIRRFHMPKDGTRTSRHVPVKRVILAIEENLRDDMARAMTEYAITHSDFVEQVRYAQRAVSAGVETEYIDRLRNVALRCVVPIAFVVAMGDIEVEYGKSFFPVGRKPLNNRICHCLLGVEVNRAYFQPRIYNV
jgi:hypothetical protein